MPVGPFGQAMTALTPSLSNLKKMIQPEAHLSVTPKHLPSHLLLRSQNYHGQMGHKVSEIASLQPGRLLGHGTMSSKVAIKILGH